jgi:hypothetical protein
MFELPYLLHNGTSRPQKEPYGVTCIWLYSRRNRGGTFWDKSPLIFCIFANVIHCPLSRLFWMVSTP